MRSVLMVFAIAGLLVCSATARTKSYTVRLMEKSTLGGIQLKPGSYRMQLENSMAILSNDEQKQVAKVPVTVTSAVKKYDRGEILSEKNADNSDKIDAIELEGTKLKVEFKN